MGANTRIWVQVEVTKTEWREVYAVTLDAAREKAHSLPGVIDVLDAIYADDETAVTVTGSNNAD
jgi:hypothetical protein